MPEEAPRRSPREGLGFVLVKMGHARPPFEPRRRPQAGKSGDPVPRTPTGIKNRVGDDGGSAILQCRSSDLYLTDRKENMAISPHSSPHLQIRPSLVHPFLPQDLDVSCNARASC